MALLLRYTVFIPPKPNSKSVRMSQSITSSLPSSEKRKLPILLFDVMDTIVRDPFYQDVPAFFRMPMKELIECKHPTAWIDFELGLINETDLARKFFKDGRTFDLEGLKECMRRGYSYTDGVETLLRRYTIIEDKLKISKYLSWTFCSCIIGKRKPAVDSYLEVLRRLKVEPSNCIFIDDRMLNVEAAMNAGIVGLHFKDAASLEQDLSSLGIETSLSTDDYKDEDLPNLT
ncbi:PREDICTED: uncharacterized protein LOC104589354 isoform X2 [Nelumbo nucifera]|uniref:Uncharacterized protein LOC104589354 isoform X2 n=1 Tax=Nelumbo nucifera TaxID=4432 RepID=A0A1U7YZ75_NELNU|nr:PREDICTED: uncharacterized protein LOC104589354 isoform X2 [Nelumbo nucifera]